MKLASIAIKFALGEKDWGAAVRLLASLFPLDGIEEAIRTHGISTSVVPAWDTEEVQIRWQYNIYYWRRGQVISEPYPVHYPAPIAIVYCKGI